MRNKWLFVFCTLIVTMNLNAQNPFDKYFENKSMRIDFALYGNTGAQSAAIQQIREEPIWGGPQKNLIDPFKYGGYYIKIFDKASQKLIYSRGFNTLFEEWRTTKEAKDEKQSWTNNAVFPFPKKPIIFELSARDKNDMQFHPLLRQEIDPASIVIDREKLVNNKLHTIVNNGPSDRKVDLVFIGEGYTKAEQGKFLEDAKKFSSQLFKVPPFDKNEKAFNVHAVEVISEESGTDVSGEGIYRNTALNSGFYTFGIDRYLTTRDMKSIRDAVWNVPCDAIFILINTERYGGGGMYNLYACGTAGHPLTLKVFTHEFGHSFAGLADEYFTSDVAYEDFYNLKYEPWEPNLTTLVNFETKWKDLLSKDTPIPTPLDEKHKDSIGVFEGGGYVSKKVYRPKDHCMMRDFAPFCPVCSREIQRMIDFLTDK